MYTCISITYRYTHMNMFVYVYQGKFEQPDHTRVFKTSQMTTFAEATVPDTLAYAQIRWRMHMYYDQHSCKRHTFLVWLFWSKPVKVFSSASIQDSGVDHLARESMGPNIMHVSLLASARILQACNAYTLFSKYIHKDIQIHTISWLQKEKRRCHEADRSRET